MAEDEKQLTVAELLARAQKESSERDRPRRRRRRSLEEGGISVAELTGSFPKVEERVPESKHSSVPIDEPTPAPAKPAEKKPEAAKPAEKPAPAKPAAAKPAAAKPAAAKPAEKPAPAKSAPSKSAPSKSAPAKSDSADATTQIPKVDTRPKVTPRKPAVADATKPAPAAKPATPAADDTASLAAVKEPVREDDTKRGSTKLDASRHDEALPATTDQDAVDHADDDSSESEGLNVLALIGLTIGGLILGVAVFLGFEYLWSHLNKILVAVLAVVVTLVMMGVIKAMRTERDGMSLVLAGVVGLLMTFGPAAIVFL